MVLSLQNLISRKQHLSKELMTNLSQGNYKKTKDFVWVTMEKGENNDVYKNKSHSVNHHRT